MRPMSWLWLATLHHSPNNLPYCACAGYYQELFLRHLQIGDDPGPCMCG
jgi:hypothetical protein